MSRPLTVPRALVVAAAVFALTACSGSETSAPETAATPPPTLAPRIDDPVTSDEVIERFPDANAAYTIGARLIAENQIGADLPVPIAEVNSLDLSPTRDALTAARQKDWDRNLASLDDEDAYASIAVLHGLGVDSDDDLQFEDEASGEALSGGLRADGPPAIEQMITDPRLSVDEGRLRADFTSSATLRATADGKNYLIPISNKTTLWFKAVNGKWKIDGWNAEWDDLDVAELDD
jgi:hypothetical protein